MFARKCEQPPFGDCLLLVTDLSLHRSGGGGSPEDGGGIFFFPRALLSTCGVRCASGLTSPIYGLQCWEDDFAKKEGTTMSYPIENVIDIDRLY